MGFAGRRALPDSNDRCILLIPIGLARLDCGGCGMVPALPSQAPGARAIESLNQRSSPAGVHTCERMPADPGRSPARFRRIQPSTIETADAQARRPRLQTMKIQELTADGRTAPADAS